MLMHEKSLPRQFFDLKNERHHHLPLHHQQHHHQQHHQQFLQQHHLQIHQQQQELNQTSPPPSHISSAIDLYSYAYKHGFGNQGDSNECQKNITPHSMGVLDLSRRSDSEETSRKTSSPYETNLSCSGVVTPATSPNTATGTEVAVTPSSHSTSDAIRAAAAAAFAAAAVANATTPLISANLLYSAQAQQQGLTSLYPALYCPPNGIKQEVGINVGSSALSPPDSIRSPKSQSPLVSAGTTNLLKPFAVTKPPPSNHLHERNASPSHNMHTPTVATNSVNITTMTTVPTSIVSSASSTTSHLLPSLSKQTSLNNETNSVSSLNADSSKNTRPFKAFPRDPFVIAANFAATDILLDNSRAERYTEYRKRVLEQIRNSNGGTRTISNPKMRRTNSRSGSINEGSSSNNNSESEDRVDRVEESSDCDSNGGNFDKRSQIEESSATINNNTSSSNANCNGSQVKDAAYYERRRKNNAAAKKSRDRRRIKEDEIAIRAAYLERQNIELLCQIDSLKAQLAARSSNGTV